ncbi:ribulose-bisphosphate carboxylase large subunit family protein [Piscinibacter sakaiensis]|uniref:ribulose-bisphosphate carboxylase large subunit family protein n=1 Tax=Piscinibacter sakaiensis TaxID=1547922 RepID=UPI003AAD30E7
MMGSTARAEFRARYWVESFEPLERVAEVIAGEQSSGTFLQLAGESDELRARARARVVSVTPRQQVEQPSLFSEHLQRGRGDAGFTQGEIEIAFPIANVGANLSTLLATVAGNLFELGEVTGLRLLDLDLPDDFIDRFARPQFGIAGTRRLAGVFYGPLIGTIIKPSVGLTPEATAQLVDALCEGGIDFIKDDELMADPPYAPFEARLRAVMPVLQRHAELLGRMPMYAINISGDVDEMRRRHDLVHAAGGSCVMVSVNWTGPAAVESLRRHCELPIHGHRNGWGLFSRSPALGIAFEAYQKIWRLAGVDHLHVNGLRNKFWEPDESVVRSARACLAPWGSALPLMPVFSSGQTALQAAATHARIGCDDLMHLAGGGIIGHPGGIAAGVASMRQAWQAAANGQSLADAARMHPELAAAIAAFGDK